MVFDVKSLKNLENTHNFHHNPLKIDHFTAKFLNKDKHEIIMQSCDVMQDLSNMANVIPCFCNLHVKDSN